MTRFHWILIILIPTFVLSIYIYKDAHIILDKTNSESYVQQDGITSIGYENGKKVFEVKIKSLRQKGYKHILYSDTIINGTIFNSDQYPIIKKISGQSGRINTHLKNIIVTNNVVAHAVPKTSTKNILINAEHFRYSHYNKVSDFSKRTNIYIHPIDLIAKKFIFYTEENLIDFKDSITIKNKTSTTNANKGLLFLNNDQLMVTGNIKTIYKAQQNKTYSDQIKALIKSESTLQSDYLTINYENSDFPTATYSSNVLAKQPKKSLSADKIILNFESKSYTALGKVTIKLANLNWLKNKKKKYKNKKLQSLLNKKTSIQSSVANFNEKKNLFTLNNNVIIKQDEFNLFCKEFQFNFSTDQIIASGNVIIKKFGIKHLESDILIIDVKNETFRSGTKGKLSEITLDISE